MLREWAWVMERMGLQMIETYHHFKWFSSSTLGTCLKGPQPVSQISYEIFRNISGNIEGDIRVGVG